MAKINKEYGEGAVVTGSEIIIRKRFTTGCLSVDVALGGGFPANQPIEIIGQESHGKTAFTLKTIAANQRLNPDFLTLWVAAETYDTDQAAALGVDNDRVIVHSTQAMEEAFDVMLAFGESRAVDAIVLDSYPALVPDEENAKDMDEFSMAIGARLVGKFFRKWGRTARVDPRDPDVKPILGPIIINQYRDAIGTFSPQGGTPKTTPGGKAKNYAFYCRVEVARADWIKDRVKGVEVKVGQTIKIKTIKNKSAAPQQVATVDFFFRDSPKHGFKRGEYNLQQDMALMAVLFDVVKKAGAWFSYDDGEHYDEKGKPALRWQGAPAMMLGIAEDPDLQAAIEAKVLARAADPTFSFTEDDLEAAATAGTKTVRRR